ncbi:MAG: hypothetical protein QOH46_3810 [Solirubrobacteraceae bacterium]|jgi:hypothetical protein|nr:hypothetical protein [Solirubrobacteraceae bacterium]
MRRPTIIALALLCALALGACGTKEHRILHGGTEGVYLDLGPEGIEPVKYQVQISRVLNPADPEDKAYLVGLPGDQSRLPAGQEWFAVFVRAQNEASTAQQAASDYTITDTQGTKFRPVQFGPENVFAYRGGRIGPHGVIPVPDSPPAETTIQGSLLLFRIPTKNLENRPLELAIRAPGIPDVATVDLDV